MTGWQEISGIWAAAIWKDDTWIGAMPIRGQYVVDTLTYIGEY